MVSHTLYYFTYKKFSGCHGDDQDLDIRTQLVKPVHFDISYAYIMRKKIFVRPGYPILLLIKLVKAEKLFLVTMETVKTNLFVLSSSSPKF